MPSPGAVRVKICCISTRWEAAVAVRAGADALGLVSAMPSGPGVINETTIAEIARVVPPGVSRFLLTSLTDADALIQQARRMGVDTLQLVDRVEPEVRRALHSALPGVRVVQVIHVQNEGALTEALAAAETADALLLDSGQPNAPVKTLGGTGHRHDWSISRTIVERAPKPVFLAGGLTPENVAEAIARVRPFGVDICSGVRRDRRLDEDRLRQFMAAIRAVE